MATRHRTTIEQDEPAIMLDVIAETVVEDAERLIGGRRIPGRAKAARHLVNYADAVYKANDRFAKKVRGAGNVGRDTLYVFMEHWLASWLKKNATMRLKQSDPVVQEALRQRWDGHWANMPIQAVGNAWYISNERFDLLSQAFTTKAAAEVYREAARDKSRELAHAGKKPAKHGRYEGR